MTKDISLQDIAKAIYTVNRHAKAAPQPKQLYNLKKASINKLMREKKVTIIGLQFSQNPKNSVQHSTLLVQIGDYYFHTIPTKADIQHVPHLGEINYTYRNPKTHMSLSHARNVLYAYLNWEKPIENQQYSTYYTPSSLGKWQGHHNGRNKNRRK